MGPDGAPDYNIEQSPIETSDISEDPFKDWI